MNEATCAEIVADEVRKTAARCLQILQQQTFLSSFPADDPGGCDGCKEGWCQSAVDAVCESRNRVKDAIAKEFGL